MSDRKVILKMVMSLDGFVTSPDGTHEWMFEWFGDDSREWNLRALEAAGVHAMGRRSYEIMGPHWAASQGPIATAMNEKPKAVFSRTLERAEWGPVEIFGQDLGAEIAARVMAEAFDWLDAPVLRVTGKDVPMPYAANLERLAVPQVEDIVAAVREVTYR